MFGELISVEKTSVECLTGFRKHACGHLFSSFDGRYALTVSNTSEDQEQAQTRTLSIAIKEFIKNE